MEYQENLKKHEYKITYLIEGNPKKQTAMVTSNDLEGAIDFLDICLNKERINGNPFGSDSSRIPLKKISVMKMPREKTPERIWN
jgi:hypothetical protein